MIGHRLPIGAEHWQSIERALGDVSSAKMMPGTVGSRHFALALGEPHVERLGPLQPAVSEDFRGLLEWRLWFCRAGLGSETTINDLALVTAAEHERRAKAAAEMLEALAGAGRTISGPDLGEIDLDSLRVELRAVRRWSNEQGQRIRERAAPRRGRPRIAMARRELWFDLLFIWEQLLLRKRSTSPDGPFSRLVLAVSAPLAEHISPTGAAISEFVRTAPPTDGIGMFAMMAGGKYPPSL